MIKRKLIFLYTVCLISISLIFTGNILAQTYLGISTDFGNGIDYQADNGNAYFRRPLAISGSLTFQIQEDMRNDWFLRYGVTAGVLGYNVKVILTDTISKPTSSEPYPFLDYTNIFTSLQFDFGRHLKLYERKFSWLVGGGVSRYFNMFPGGVAGSVSVVDDNNSLYRIFYYEMYPSNKFSAFAEMAVQIELSQRISVGLAYRHHFKSALEGTFEFDHVDEPSTGDMDLNQKALSVLFLVKVGKKVSSKYHESQ